MSGTIIVACTLDRLIGIGDQIPWRHPGDLKRFRALTMGGVVVMGRRTWESLPKRPLDGRINVVVTSRTICQLGVQDMKDVVLSRTVADANRIACSFGRPVWWIGGGRLYREALHYADMIDMTVVPDLPDIYAVNSVYFPDLVHLRWERISIAPHPNAQDCMLVRYARCR